MDDLSLKQFTAVDAAADVPSYVAALEAFDGIEQLQELKALGRERGGFAPGKSVLDVGCGFGLETLRLARLGGPGSAVAGIDKSADFIEDAGRRAAGVGLRVDFRVGDATALLYGDAGFDCVRAERLLSTSTTRSAPSARCGGSPGRGRDRADRAGLLDHDHQPARPRRGARALAHEADTAVVRSWLPGPLLAMLGDLVFADTRVATRVVIFPQDSRRHLFRGRGAPRRRGGSPGAGRAERLARRDRRPEGAGPALRLRRLLPSHGHGLRDPGLGGGGTLSSRRRPGVAAGDAP